MSGDISVDFWIATIPFVPLLTFPIILFLGQYFNGKDWWKNILDARVKQSPGLRYFAAYDVIRKDKGGAKSMVTIRDSGKWNGT